MDFIQRSIVAAVAIVEPLIATNSANAVRVVACAVHAVIFVGVQGSGKSTFYERHFASTHLRVSMDIAGTRARERRLIEHSLARKLELVIDNTNPTMANRKPYIEDFKTAGYRIIGYYFVLDIKECLARNAQRTGKAKVPVPGIYRVRKIMEPPTYAEGFDEIYQVQSNASEFVVTPVAKEPLPPVRSV